MPAAADELARIERRADGVELIAIDPTHDARWPELLAAFDAGIFHSPPWMRSLADAYGFAIEARVGVDADGRPVAGMPFCRVADLVGERTVSLPFSDYCDPLVRSAADWELLFREVQAIGHAATFRCLHDRIAPADRRLRTVKRARWHLVPVDTDLSALWSHVAPPAKRAIRKAEREGVTIASRDDETVLGAFVRLHVALRKRKYRLLAQPRAFFAAIRARFRAVGGWFPLAACHRGRIIAVTIYLRWGDTLYYKFNASLPEASALRPNDALLWEGIRLAHRLGCRRLDLGASDDDQPGLIRFKRHYGGEEKEITFLCYTPPGRVDDGAQALATLARLTGLLTDPAVPDEITERAGAELYRFFA